MTSLVVGDYGTAIRISLTDAITGAAVDLSEATALTLKVRKPLAANPSRTEDKTWTATAYGEATAGVVQYVTADGDVDAPGTYLVHAVAQFGALSLLTSTVSTLEVRARFA